MMPPCRSGRRVSRSQARALCQSCTACLRDIAANRTGPATLPRHTGQGARVWGKPGRTAEIECKGASGVAAQPARKRLTLGALRQCTPKGLAKIREVGEALIARYRDPPASAGMQTRPSRRVLLFQGSGVAASRRWSRARRLFRAPRKGTAYLKSGTTGKIFPQTGKTFPAAV